jgi:Ankyrin repeats (3 copies)
MKEEKPLCTFAPKKATWKAQKSFWSKEPTLTRLTLQVNFSCLKFKNFCPDTVCEFAGWTPLHEASNHGHYHLAQVLVKHGANVNSTGLDDVTPLHDAASFGNQKLVKFLIDKGADPFFKNKKGKTPQDISHPSLAHFFATLSTGE